MRSVERSPFTEAMPDFGMDPFGMDEGFDINAAFQEAVQGVASDRELAIEEKVRRMEVIVSEGTSGMYRDFVDFRTVAAQMEMMCNHDHAMSESLKGNELLSNFMDNHKANHDHDHEDEHDVDAKTGKRMKKKKRYGWFSILLK